MAHRSVALAFCLICVACTVPREHEPRSARPRGQCVVTRFVAREGASDRIALAPMPSGVIVAIESGGLIATAPYWMRSFMRSPWTETPGARVELSPHASPVHNDVVMTFFESGRTLARSVDALGNVGPVTVDLTTIRGAMSSAPACSCSGDDTPLEVWVNERDEGTRATVDVGRVFDVDIAGRDPSVARASDARERVVTQVDEHHVLETTFDSAGRVDTRTLTREERIIGARAIETNRDAETWLLLAGAETTIEGFPENIAWTDEGSEALAFDALSTGRGWVAAVVLTRNGEGAYALRVSVRTDYVDFAGDVVTDVRASEPPVPILGAVESTFYVFWREDARVNGAAIECMDDRGI